MLRCVKDVNTLAACAQVSSHYRALASCCILNNLSDLLLANYGKPRHTPRRAVKWLCWRAGPAAVNSDAVQTAFLQLLADQNVDRDATLLIKDFADAGDDYFIVPDRQRFHSSFLACWLYM